MALEERVRIAAGNVPHRRGINPFHRRAIWETLTILPVAEDLRLLAAQSNFSPRSQRAMRSISSLVSSGFFGPGPPEPKEGMRSLPLPYRDSCEGSEMKRTSQSLEPYAVSSGPVPPSALPNL